MPITNISCYKFAPLADLRSLKESLIAQCRGWNLKGTILLSAEGINFFVAGGRAEIDLLVAELRSLPGLGDLTPKYSVSGEQPFTRMLVRIKKEIIAFGVEGIDPATRPSPKIAARTLKQWLDEGRPVTLLDTRNNYEVRLGTFQGARTLGIKNFRQFPGVVETLPSELKDQPVVMFCTGGIRCEKAGPLMEARGFRSIFQLDGGILKYFEECGGAHYDGECFVFDQRVGVDPALRETESVQCHACQMPLNADEQKDSRYVAGISCPYCHETGRQAMTKRIAQREAAIRRAATPLPGSIPIANRRPLRVPAKLDGVSVLDFLCGLFAHVAREHWQAVCSEGGLVDGKGAAASGTRIVRAGETYFRLTTAVREPDVNAGIRILHEDEAIIVLDKPAPLPMHPGGRFNRNTLQFFLNAAYAPQKPRSVHRLDAGTTGVVVFARTRHFARLLQPQFEEGTVKKTYLARVHGHPAAISFSCDLSVSAGPDAEGCRGTDGSGGLPARTEFRVLERKDDDTALLEARPLTGRTNQIRIHLAALGHPICGDAAYADGRPGRVQTPAPGDPPLCLHASSLEFTHPVTQTRVCFLAETPPQIFGPERSMSAP